MAYEPAATPPGATSKAPLTPEQRRAAIVAGAVAGGMFGIGWGILGVAAIFLVLVVLYGMLLAIFLGGADVTGGLGAVIVVILVVALAVGVVLIVLAVKISKRILTRGGVNRPTAVTWLSLLIVLVVNTIAQRIADPYITLGGEPEVSGLTRALVVALLVAIAVGAGIGAWLLMTWAFRGAQRSSGAVPLVPTAGAEPAATTLTAPPPVPPPAV